MRTSLSWRLSLPGWLSLLALGLALWLIITYADLFWTISAILFAAFLLSLAIRPLADTLARWRIPRGVTVLGVYLGLVGLLVILSALLLPVVTAETKLLQTKGPDLLQTALAHLMATPFLASWSPSLDTLIQNLTQYAAILLPTFVSTVASAGEMTLDLLIVLILAYFFAADEILGERLLRSVVPLPHQSHLSIVLIRLRDRLTRWVWAQVTIALYFALTFGLGLVWLGVPFALTIALVGGVLEIIPYIGGAVALLLSVLSALTINPWLALWVSLFYTVVIQVQSHLVAPLFYGRAMQLHPALVLLTLFIGARSGGIVGVFFAVPVTVVLITLLQELQQRWSVSETESLTSRQITRSEEQTKPQSLQSSI